MCPCDGSDLLPTFGHPSLKAFTSPRPPDALEGSTVDFDFECFGAEVRAADKRRILHSIAVPQAPVALCRFRGLQFPSSASCEGSGVAPARTAQQQAVAAVAPCGGCLLRSIFRLQAYCLLHVTLRNLNHPMVDQCPVVGTYYCSFCACCCDSRQPSCGFRGYVGVSESKLELGSVYERIRHCRPGFQDAYLLHAFVRSGLRCKRCVPGLFRPLKVAA